MQIEQVVSMLRWINETDPRVQFNEPAVEVWHYALSTVEPAVAKQAVLEHYKANESVAASPGAISKRSLNIRNSRDAATRAITAAPGAPKHPSSWRARNPERWDELFEAGRREGNEAREAATRARAGL